MHENAALSEYMENVTATMATGCAGAGAFRRVFREMGYQHLEIMSWTSSASDWWFLVSEDGERWYNASQENRWPRAGFEYYVDRELWVDAPAKEAVAIMWEIAAA